EQLVVSDGQNVAAFDAFDGLRAPIVFRQEAEFAHDSASRNLNSELLDEKLSRHRIKHLFCGIAFAKEGVALPMLSSCHEWLSPIHRQVALRGDPRFFDKVEHLMETKNIDRQR